ncbi:MAG: hypothetical protein WBD97_05860, partial [Pseudolabrys sp.]
LARRQIERERRWSGQKHGNNNSGMSAHEMCSEAKVRLTMAVSYRWKAIYNCGGRHRQFIP